MASDEMYGFVFSLLFLIFFGTLLATIPADLQGQGGAGDVVTPINPSLVTGFSDSEWYVKTNYTGSAYEYNFNSRYWIATYTGTYLTLSAKKLILGFWLGGLDVCDFINPDGTNRGNTLEFTEIDTDADDGAVRYVLQFADGDPAGYFVVSWNTTTYATASLAWAGEELYLLHGVGFDNYATNNIGALLVSLLLLQLPDVPILVNLFLATPPWACIIFVLWYIITSMIPFVGGS